MARYVPIPGHRMLYIVIAAPFLMLAAPVAIMVLTWGRRWVLVGLAGSMTLLLLVIQLPWYVSEAPNPASAAVKVMTINMYFGHADPNAVARTARDCADVLLVQELTPEAVRGLSAAGIKTAFPYQELDARPGAAGIGLYSRFPITDAGHIGGHRLAMVRARVRIPHVAHDVSILSVHLDAPWPRPVDGWQADIAKFPSTLSDVATRAGDGAVVVGGDFNSTIDMREFRELLTNGYHDAARQAGSGRTFTYPANKWYPPVIGIDHVLTRNATAVSTSTVELPGTDHRALLATVLVPTD